MPSHRRWIGAVVASALLAAVGAGMALGSQPPGRSSGLTAVTRSAVASGEQRPEDLATVAFGQQYVFPSGVGVAVAAPMMQVPRAVDAARRSSSFARRWASSSKR